MNRPALATLLLAASLMLGVGCASHPPRTGADAKPTTALPPPPAWLAELEHDYPSRLRVAGIESRRFAPEAWWDIVTPLLTAERGFQVAEAGRSAEGRMLRHVRWGEGATPILLWSQMHGDESTATMALADLFRFLGEQPDHPLVQRLRTRTTLHLLPLMNPDGALRFQRRNAQGVDINRDARALASPEAQALKRLYDKVGPAFSFNLHDQQAGYRAGDSARGTAIALLAPPPDGSGEIGPLRRRAIEVAVAIRAALEPALAGHLARWDETFNPRAFGDLSAQWGSSTILIEAGAIEGDVQKQTLRRHYFLALVAALDSIATGTHAGLDPGHYFDLPENGKVWPDLIIRGGTLIAQGTAPLRADVLIDFKDALTETGGTIKDVGDLTEVRARREIDARGLFLRPIACPPDGPAQVTSRALLPAAPACLSLSRDAEGRDVVWTLLRDVDPRQPAPSR
ncbi:M14 family zinc carboxypeptidase [Luteimonas sp. e5]